MSSYTNTTGEAAAGAAGDLGRDETGSLIAASKVNGTAVYNRAGESLGTIHDVMIDKRRGQVSYAVMSFGGFLGLGEKYHPLPWNLLTYDERQGGYVVNLDKSVLQGAPAYSDSGSGWDNGAYATDVDRYYEGRAVV